MIDGDELYDLRLNGDREVEIGEDGDLRITDPIETVEQSVMIDVGNVVREIIGNPLTAQTYTEVESGIRDSINSDPQIQDIQRLEITEVNRDTGVVTVDIFVSYDESFTLEIPT